MKSGRGDFSFCAVVVVWLGVSYSSLAVWVYVIMGGRGWGAGSPSCGGVCCCVSRGDLTVYLCFNRSYVSVVY